MIRVAPAIPLVKPSRFKKSAPFGIGIGYMILTDTVEHPQRIPQPDDTAFTNPHTQYVTCRSSWAKLEPSEGNFYWDFLDACVNNAISANKKFSLTIADGVISPMGWLTGAGAIVFNLTIAAGDVEPMPVPWDPVFQEKWSTMMTAVAARYGSSGQLSYVDLPIGHKVEGFFCKTSADIATFNAMGGLPIWKTGVQWKIDAMASIFPDKPFILDLGSPISTPEGNDALQAMCDYGVAHHPGNHFAVASHGLRYPNGPGANSIGAKECQLLSKTSSPGFQVADSERGAQLDNTLGLGVGWGAHFIEVRGPDCDDPTSYDVLDKWSSELLKNKWIATS